MSALCSGCKFWIGNGGIDCSDNEDEFGNPVKTCAYFEAYVEDV